MVSGTGLVSAEAEMADVRRSIDNLDTALIAILAERFRLTEKIGITKARVGLPALDPERESKQLQHLRELATAHGLSVNVVDDVMSRIIPHAKDRHEALMRGA